MPCRKSFDSNKAVGRKRKNLFSWFFLLVYSNFVALGRVPSPLDVTLLSFRVSYNT